MADFRNKFNPEQAAKFLGISEGCLALLTDDGTIRHCSYKGKRYYLGGELDSAKSLLRNRRRKWAG